MQTLTIDEASEQFAKLMERVQHGETILIANGSGLIVQIVPVRPSLPVHRRIGFLKGQGHVPENWKELDREEIERDFYGDE